MPPLKFIGAVFFACLLLGVADVCAQSLVNTDDATTHTFFHRGVTITCPRSGQVWATDATAHSMDEIKQLGGNAVTIHPYARIHRDGSVRFSPEFHQRTVSASAQFAKERGLYYFLKPHLAYWGSGFSWRGEIDFKDDAEAWGRFNYSYTQFITSIAAQAEEAGAQLFAVGVELKATEHFNEGWRRIIDDVRKVYSGKVVYSANWDSIHKVKFWDACDYIGIQGYFPVTTSDNLYPTEEQLHEAWNKLLAELEQLSHEYNRPIIFCELGYDHTPRAAVEPWKGYFRTEYTDKDFELQERLYKVALERLERADFVHGVYLWKWNPIPESREDFRVESSRMQQFLKTRWGN